jgi:hypothetical protein
MGPESSGMGPEWDWNAYFGSLGRVELDSSGIGLESSGMGLILSAESPA